MAFGYDNSIFTDKSFDYQCENNLQQRDYIIVYGGFPSHAYDATWFLQGAVFTHKFMD